MSKNPLFNKNYYYTSSMYSDNMLIELFSKMNVESYEKSKALQLAAPGIEIHYNKPVTLERFTLDKLVVDMQFNRSIGISPLSSSIKIPNYLLQIRDYRTFIKRYGKENQIIPLMDLLIRTDTFNKFITIQISDYRIFQGYFLFTKSKDLYYILEDSPNGISYSILNALCTENPTDYIYFNCEPKTTVYQSSGSTISFEVGDKGEDDFEIKIPISGLVAKYITPINTIPRNSWECIISYENFYLCVATNASFISKDESYINFSVSKTFWNSVKSKRSNVAITLKSTPNKSMVYKYRYSENIRPIIYPSNQWNPSINSNIEIYKFDSVNNIKYGRLYDPDLTQMYFPNIFDLTLLNDNDEDLVIEITEYNESYTGQKMFNPIKCVTDIFTTNQYASAVVNDYLHLDSDLNYRSLNPIGADISVEDFLVSEYNDDPRGYVLNKICKMMESNPALYKTYLEYVRKDDTRLIVKDGYPIDIGFGGLSSLGDAYTNNFPVVISNALTVVNDAYILRFDCPHSYIRYNTSHDEKPAMFYFNGKRLRPTIINYYDGLNYAYFPVDKVLELLTEFNSINVEGSSTTPIIVDLFPDSFMSYNDAKKATIKDVIVKDELTPYAGIGIEKSRLGDLLLYDNTTNKVYGFEEMLDLMKIYFEVSAIDINDYTFDGDNPINKEEIQYLVTSLGKLFKTIDELPIILSEDSTIFNVGDIVDMLVAEQIYADRDEALDDIMNKVVKTDDILIELESSILIGHDLTFTFSNFLDNSVRHGYDIESNNDIKTLTFNTIAYGNNPNKYIVYKNGYIFRDYEIDYISNNLEGEVILKINTSDYIDSDEFELVFMPHNYRENKLEVVTDYTNSTTLPFTTSNYNVSGTTIKDIFPICNKEDLGTDNIDLIKESIYTNDIDDYRVLRWSIGGKRILPFKCNFNSSIFSIYRDCDIRSIVDNNTLADSNNYIYELKLTTGKPILALGQNLSHSVVDETIFDATEQPTYVLF